MIPLSHRSRKVPPTVVRLAPVALAVSWAVGLGVNRSLRRARGASMEPTILDGQLVGVVPVTLRAARVGDVVVAEAPERSGVPTWIKRVAAVGPAVFPAPHPVIPGRTVDLLLDEGEAFLVGDNLDASTDSRHVGAVHVDAITHVVIWPR